MKKVLLATNNHGKIERFRKLVAQAGLEVELLTPAELGIKEIDVIEDRETLVGNASKKAEAYLGQVDFPILANDTGFWIETEGFVDAPKRMALQGKEEKSLSKEQVAEKLLSFWKGKAAANGGKVDAAWVEEFVLLSPDGSVKNASSRREIILTDTEFGEPHIQMPVRALYISKTTNKPSIQHTEEEEWQELQPIIVALKELLEW